MLDSNPRVILFEKISSSRSINIFLSCDFWFLNREANVWQGELFSSIFKLKFVGLVRDYLLLTIFSPLRTKKRWNK